jgi:DNA-binding CsgD family transcriptional regulator
VARSQGDAAQAYLYYAESLTVFVELMDKQSIPQCLEGIAGLANAAGQPAHAARLFGAAEALCESAGVPLPPVMRAEYDLDVAATRAQLDEPTFATAWDARRALTLEQAIAYALEPPPAVTPPAPPVTPPPIPSISAYPAGLTEREVAVLRLLAQGLSYAEIATQLVISPRTVNRHLTAIYSKLDVTSRHAASRFATDQHLV